ncbi:MAG TPA: glycosyltransferase family 2 protein [Deltaproteobacteria bacterium]|nr:glycosyltransferase family 2 protein [Deltaproteobacteria bacterium]
MESPPRITIVTPSYNQAPFLEAAIRSVLLQEYSNLEYFIMDGKSTDGSVEIIRRYEPWLAGWVSEPDRGQSHAINKGWKKATGDIIAWLNADDFYLPGAFSTVAQAFSSNHQARVFSGIGEIRDASGSVLMSTKNPSSFDAHAMLSACGGVPLQPSVFLNRLVLDEVGYLNEDLHYTMDWEYWIRLSLHYPADSFIEIDKALSVNREWADTKTRTGWKHICREHRQVMDGIFSSFPYDDDLQGIRDRAYRSSYLKEADLALKNRDRAGSLRSIMRAWLIRPFAHNPRDELVTLMHLFGYYRVRDAR